MSHRKSDLMLWNDLAPAASCARGPVVLARPTEEEVVPWLKLRQSGSMSPNEVLGFFGRLARGIVGLEACGGSHFWAREIRALGHDVRLIPPAYVKPYVKRGKTDAVDAEAICEAVSRPTMRFVPIKTAECQAALMVLKTRDLLVRQRTQAINAVRGHLAELGIVAAKGLAKVETLIAIVRDDNDQRLPPAARTALNLLADQIEMLTERIDTLGREIVAEVRRDDTMRRLATIPGIGPITAATIQALVPDPAAFKSGRHFAAWIGLTPKMHSSGGKECLGEDLQDGEPDAAFSSRRGRDSSVTARSPRRHDIALADRIVGTPARQGGSHSVG